MKRNTVQTKLIAAGVKNLKEYGYPLVNAENILQDMIYVGFFRSMLRDNLGVGFDADIKSLLAETEGREP